MVTSDLRDKFEMSTNTDATRLSTIKTLIATTRVREKVQGIPALSSLAPANQRFGASEVNDDTLHDFSTTRDNPPNANMATELTVQSERAFQKQPHIFLNSKVKAKSARAGKGGRRWYKDVGLGFRTPKTAIEGTYIDKKCPFVGQVSIRGRILTGTVVSTKMHRTLIIRREYLHFVPKYARYEKRHKNLAAHVSPAFRVEEGDQVTVGQCRPLSKTVRFNVLRVLPRTGKAVKAFSKF
ncbi:hypothetical protein V492_02114 [Pseudogymnoascus sp. VKM F-4246]|nr:hypothetical protein V492_02114 [Pseudogymnoascus sp. VKM F-4246]KFY41133.1 hypothetical protein V494_03196 [Pseudogymnoascus sp. VKM F-4513 (FW-928)]